MTGKHKGPKNPDSSKASPRKKAKLSNGNGDGQGKLAGFMKTPDKKGKGASSAQPDNGIISLLSDSEPGDDAGLEHISVAGPSSSSKRRVIPKDSEVIDLDILSSDTDNEVIKPVAGPSGVNKGSNASVHPLFRKTAVKLENGSTSNAASAGTMASAGQDDGGQDETKPVIDIKGKGKGKAETTGLESPKKLVFPKTETDEPICYPLEKDIFEFDPKNDISTDTWPRTQAAKLHTPYSFLVAAFVLISATRSRLIIVTVLTNTLRTIVEFDPEALKDAVYLITNHVAPAYEGVELGIGGQVLGKALKAVSGAGPGVLRSLWHQYGDAGDVAFHAKAKVRTLFASQPLTIASLYNNLVTLTGLKGTGTVNKKADIVQRMLVAAKGEEVRFLVRTLVAHLRIGAVRLTVTASLARAFCLIQPRKVEEGSEAVDRFYITAEERTGVKAVAKTVKDGKDDPKRLELMNRLTKAESLVREVYVRHPNYDNIVPALLSVGLSGLSDAIPLQVGTPLSPMLGQITRDLGDVAGRLEPTREFAAEWKYDGQRVQIHCERRKKGEVPAGESKLSSKKGGGQWVNGDVYVRLFSRHLEDMTAKYPDILQLMPELLSYIQMDEDGNETGVQSFIMDAEIVAIDSVTKALLTFQTLANRARKDVNIHEVKVKVGIFAFDLMYLNGQTLINKSFRERRHLLKSRFPPREPSEPTIARFDHVKCMEGFPSNLEPIRQFMLEAISQKCEGLMLKLLDSAEASAETVKDEDLDEELTAEEADESEEDQLDAHGGDDPKSETEPVAKKGRRKALLATYEPDKRVESWVKVKRDYGDLGDSLDVVPIGAWHGQGRKAGWWSPILLAVYDPDTETFQALCKCISGFTDAFYKQLNEKYPEGSETCSRNLNIPAESGLRPEVWWEPNEVWEIRGADLTLSPVYTAAAGLVSAERGLSLRFPRFIKVREDKSIEQATTPQDLADAYQRQSEGHQHPKAGPVAPTAPTETEQDFSGF